MLNLFNKISLDIVSYINGRETVMYMRGVNACDVKCTYMYASARVVSSNIQIRMSNSQGVGLLTTKIRLALDFIWIMQM